MNKQAVFDQDAVHCRTLVHVNVHVSESADLVRRGKLTVARV